MKEAFEKLKERLEEEELTSADAKAEAIIGMQGASANYYGGELRAFGRAIQIVSEVEAEYINKSTEHINKSSDCSSGWIPCSERLPENDDDVLVWYRYRTMQGVNIVGSKETHGIGYYYKPTNSWLIYGGFGLYWNVIAWMPLPESYNPEKGAQDGGDNEGNNKD